MPLFTDVAGTVRVDCTVPDDNTVCSVIPQSVMVWSLCDNPSTSHARTVPLPLQWNRAFIPPRVVTDTGPSVT